jgi:hypothetical protein
MGLERFVGIGWDFHPDSVHYSKNSIYIANGLFERGFLSWFNGGYYYIMYLLNQDVFNVTLYNLILYALTNVFISKMHWEARSNYVISIALLLLLLNPYRIHLATTMLKDTTMIFLAILIFYRLRFAIILIMPTIMIRMASLFYFIAWFKPRSIKYIIFIGICAFVAFPDPIIAQLDSSGSIDLKTRDFDNIPSFQEYGYLGSVIRGIVWPLLALSGLFVFISPAFAYIFVALGCFMNIIYTYTIYKKPPILLRIFIPMAIIAILAPGFTSFIRYVYPLIIVTPLLMGLDFLKLKKEKKI